MDPQGKELSDPFPTPQHLDQWVMESGFLSVSLVYPGREGVTGEESSGWDVMKPEEVGDQDKRCGLDNGCGHDERCEQTGVRWVGGYVPEGLGWEERHGPQGGTYIPGEG